MILTVADIIKDAMGLIGAIAADEVPTASEYTMCLRVANTMIDRWSSQRLLLRSTSPLTIPITSGKSSYTVGLSGCDVTANKPIRVISAYIRDSGGNDSNLEIMDLQQYLSLEDKNVSNGEPCYVAYDAGDAQQTVQKGTFYFYYTPNQSYTGYLEIDNYLTEFTAVTDNVTFEPSYYEALIYNLAVRLWRHFRDSGSPVPQDIIMIAHDSLSNLRSMNALVLQAAMELPGKISKYNIYSDN